MFIGLEDPGFMADVAVQSGRRQSRSPSHHRTRGRARVEDLGRDAHSTHAPGFGYGRSGLLDRERGPGVQSMGLPC